MNKTPFTATTTPFLELPKPLECYIFELFMTWAAKMCSAISATSVPSAQLPVVYFLWFTSVIDVISKENIRACRSHDDIYSLFYRSLWNKTHLYHSTSFQEHFFPTHWMRPLKVEIHNYSLYRWLLHKVNHWASILRFLPTIWFVLYRDVIERKRKTAQWLRKLPYTSYLENQV